MQHTQEEHSLCPYCNRGVLKHGFEQHITKHHGVKPTKGISRVPLIEAFDTQTAYTVTESPNEIAPAGSFESLVDFERMSRRNEKPVEPVASSDSGEESDSKVERGARPGRYPCDMCGIVFTKLSHEIKHKKIHLGARPFNCPYCEKMFTADRGVKKHIYRLHPEHSERAWNVKLPDMNSDILKEVQTFLCLICKRTFRRKATIKEHVAVMHVGQTMRFPFARRNPQSSGMQCATCHQDYALRELQTHTCPGKSTGEKPVSIRKESVIQPFPCSICPAAFTRKDNLMTHIHKMHKDKLQELAKLKKEYACEVCGSKFPKQTRLQEHLSTHNNMKPYTCEYCKKTLKSKRSLRTHLLTLHKLTVGSADKMVCDLPDIQSEPAEDTNESVKKQHLAYANSCENCPICHEDETCAGDPTLDFDFLKQHIWTAHVPNVLATSALLSFWTLI